MDERFSTSGETSIESIDNSGTTMAYENQDVPQLPGDIFMEILVTTRSSAKRGRDCKGTRSHGGRTIRVFRNTT
jgi:hypothetical protein